MKTCLIAFCTLITFSIPSLSAAAASRPGFYFSGFLGTSIARDANVSGYDYFNSTPFSDDKVTFDPGVYVGGTGGYDFGFLRLEGELSYRGTNLDTVTFSNGERFRNIDGDLGVFATMFNVFLDLHNSSRVTPYLGGGIGFASLHLSDTYGFGNTQGFKKLYDDSSDTVAAYQVGAGMDIALNNRYSLDIGYRYFITDKATLDGDFITSSMRFESHNAMVGFKFKF